MPNFCRLNVLVCAAQETRTVKFPLNFEKFQNAVRPLKVKGTAMQLMYQQIYECFNTNNKH